jgi:large subunit ribosomal protein L25
MELVKITADVRDTKNKTEKFKLRNDGKIPGVFYMKGHETISISISEKILNPLVFTAETHLISLRVNGQEETECILKDVQYDPISDRVIHFDIIGLSKDETIEIEVPVRIHGNAVGVKDGGVVQHILHKVEVECLPRDIPQHIDLDISNLKIGDGIHISDLSLENIKFLNPKDSIIVQVTHPKLEKEPAEVVEGEEAAEPEVISRSKEDADEKDKDKDKEKVKGKVKED